MSVNINRPFMNNAGLIENNCFVFSNLIHHINPNIENESATREARKYLLSAANVWWRCAQYFVIASCG